MYAIYDNRIVGIVRCVVWDYVKLVLLRKIAYRIDIARGSTLTEDASIL